MVRALIVTLALVIIAAKASYSAMTWSQIDAEKPLVIGKNIVLAATTPTINPPLEKKLLAEVSIKGDQKLTFLEKRSLGETKVTSFVFQMSECPEIEKSDMKIVSPEELGFEGEKAVGIIVESCKLKVLVENTELEKGTFLK